MSRLFLSLVLLVLAPAPTLAQEADPAPAPVVEKPRVVLETSLGAITIELESEKAPGTVENFLTYVRDGHYDGTLFHRVVDGFMIQGGGFDGELRQKATRPPIQNEANNGLGNLRGTIAMARLPDPHSANAQFFINVVDNPNLDFRGDARPETWGYAVFGSVIAGMEVVDSIRQVPVGSVGMMGNVPTTPVVIQSARIWGAASGVEVEGEMEPEAATESEDSDG